MAANRASEPRKKPRDIYGDVTMESVLLSYEGSVLFVTINRPSSRNALDQATVRRLAEVFGGYREPLEPSRLLKTKVVSYVQIHIV